ncbi:excalibur calcium-binding domain-containing protein [Acinetobacter baumannii]|uniref:excalibur calcium-binding domain-containing protein n=1 Tax=Acinetobacter baumannii TaxID=470 RepID=UPI00070A7A55|nr:excalibur calcium-binding domain-containing protein [Acinetobacter baumannii]KRI45886.1 hypothetical protein APC31_00365 [Acinetobacter baumannii]
MKNNSRNLFLILLGLVTLLSGCIYSEPYFTVPPAPKVNPTSQRVPMTAEEARHLYNEQAQQRTINNPFSYDGSTTTPSLPKSRTAHNSTRVIKQSTSTSQGSLKCGSVPRYCKEMVNCAQAKAALKCGNSRLDRDGDGIPCENVCGG